MQESDPDTLQAFDESDEEWVKLWRKAAVKKITKNKIDFMISPLNKALTVKKLFARA